MQKLRQQMPPGLILLIVGAGVALSLPGDTTLYVALPTHTAEAGITLAQVGLMLSANRLIRLLINGPYGLLIERIPRRRMLVPSLFLGGFSYLLYTIPGFWPLLIGRLAWGVAWAGIWLGGSTVVLDLASDERRGRYSGAYQIAFFVGVGGSAILAGLLTDQLGYIQGLRVSAAIALAMALIWALFLPETRPTGTAAQDAASAPIAKQAEKSRQPLTVAILVLGVNWLVFIGVLGATMPLLLEDRFGTAVALLGLSIPLATSTGMLTAANQGVSALTAPVAGWLTDRSGRRWGLVTGALALGAASMALTAAGGRVVVILAILLAAVTTSILQTQVMTLIGDHARTNRQGRILGVANTVGDLGAALGPLAAYALLPLIGLPGIFWLSAAALVVMLPVAAATALQENRTLASGQTPFRISASERPAD
ncbi:MAG: MFS transporter [Anaerolineae bacterium]|nr:MFS transporter [Anaerolineae bacterium]